MCCVYDGLEPYNHSFNRLGLLPCSNSKLTSEPTNRFRHLVGLHVWGIGQSQGSTYTGYFISNVCNDENFKVDAKLTMLEKQICNE
jgi:hypothetical protein